jgi:hypothetical protein
MTEWLDSGENRTQVYNQCIRTDKPVMLKNRVRKKSRLLLRPYPFARTRRRTPRPPHPQISIRDSPHTYTVFCTPDEQNLKQGEGGIKILEFYRQHSTRKHPPVGFLTSSCTHRYISVTFGSLVKTVRPRWEFSVLGLRPHPALWDTNAPLYGVPLEV